jgi:hypothetical protein
MRCGIIVAWSTNFTGVSGGEQCIRICGERTDIGCMDGVHTQRTCMGDICTVTFGATEFGAPVMEFTREGRARCTGTA